MGNLIETYFFNMNGRNGMNCSFCSFCSCLTTNYANGRECYILTKNYKNGQELFFTLHFSLWLTALSEAFLKPFLVRTAADPPVEDVLGNLLFQFIVRNLPPLRQLALSWREGLSENPSRVRQRVQMGLFDPVFPHRRLSVIPPPFVVAVRVESVAMLRHCCLASSAVGWGA